MWYSMKDLIFHNTISVISEELLFLWDSAPFIWSFIFSPIITIDSKFSLHGLPWVVPSFSISLLNGLHFARTWCWYFHKFLLTIILLVTSILVKSINIYFSRVLRFVQCWGYLVSGFNIFLHGIRASLYRMIRWNRCSIKNVFKNKIWLFGPITVPGPCHLSDDSHLK